jgi:hypothetical protein
MKSSNLIGQKLQLSPKAFRQGSKTKKWQIEAKPKVFSITCRHNHQYMTFHAFLKINGLVPHKIKHVLKLKKTILTTSSSE